MPFFKFKICLEVSFLWILDSGNQFHLGRAIEKYLNTFLNNDLGRACG